MTSSNGDMSPEKVNRIVSDICKDWNLDKPSGSVNEVLAKGTEINRRVHDRLASYIHQCQLAPHLVTKNDFFVTIHKAFLDDMTSHRLSRDELVFLLAFNSAKILVDQLGPL